MSALGALLRRLWSADARLAIEDGELVVYADAGACSPALRAAIAPWREALAAVAILHGDGRKVVRARDVWDLEGASRLAAVLEGGIDSTQAAGRVRAVPRERATSTRIGSRRGGSVLGRAPSRGDRTTSPRGRGAS